MAKGYREVWECPKCGERVELYVEAIEVVHLKPCPKSSQRYFRKVWPIKAIEKKKSRALRKSQRPDQGV